MRYFSLLYAPEERRAAIAALYVIEFDIAEAARNASHEVAHTRLQWWRAEVDRLANGAPQHPASRALLADAQSAPAQFSLLHELLAAADMDLARMTYADAREARAYRARSGGALMELIARQLTSGDLDEADRLQAHRIGVGVRHAEIVRDVRQDVHDGRLYLPLDLLDSKGVTARQLHEAEFATQTREVLRTFAAEAREDLTTHAPRSHLRPLVVLAALHRRLLDRIARRDYDVGAQRVELGAFEKTWTAWRAAVRAGSSG